MSPVPRLTVGARVARPRWSSQQHSLPRRRHPRCQPALPNLSIGPYATLLLGTGTRHARPRIRHCPCVPATFKLKVRPAFSSSIDSILVGC